MLTVMIPPNELFNESTKEFIPVASQELQLEHSLISLSKWESIHTIPFLAKGKKTEEQTIDYIKCMTITKGVDPLVYQCIPDSVLEQITKYIEAPMSATTFGWEPKDSGVPETITAELIYYWMVAFTIPFDPCQKWHLNKLLTLIRVCNVKNAPDKKQSHSDMVAERRRLNAERKHKYGTKG